MAIVYPSSIDTFSVPTLPEATSLSSSGTATRNHTESHDDLGKAIMALETNATPLTHDHSTTDGGGTWPTGKLAQANTHQSPDTDALATSLHHTLGLGPTQAASGNHAHDYNGPSIFNQPLVICTSTTRPVDPLVGMVIYEKDTKCFRAWDQFSPSNIINAGINSTDLFNRTSSTNLDVALWSQSYVVGSTPTNGVMATPDGSNCSWIVGTNSNARCIARRINSADEVTDTDDQILDMYFGTQALQWNFFHPSPTNDGYLRMSSDGQSYIRFSVNSSAANIYWTTSGPSGETFLGGTGAADTLGTGSHWTFKVVGRTFIIYQDGVFLTSVADNTNVTSLGSSYRGWGIGMSAAQGIFGSQLVPAPIAKVAISDPPYYTGGLIWQLLPIGATPFLRAEAHFSQIVVVGLFGGICGFDTILEDWFFRPFMNVEESQTDIIIQESGHYDVHSSVAWHPDYFGFDHTMIGITVNGLDIGRKNWEFVRGNGFAPGFSQTNEIFFSYYFAAGDVVRVNARHNSPFACFLWFWDVSPQRQMCWVEVNFKGV